MFVIRVHIIYGTDKDRNVEITKILLLVPGIDQRSGVCDKFTQPSTSDQLSTAV